MTAVAAIDADIRRMTTASEACRRLMAIPGVGQLTALAFVAAIDDPSRIRRSRDVGAYLGLVPRRYQSGEVDYVGGIYEPLGHPEHRRTVRESRPPNLAETGQAGLSANLPVGGIAPRQPTRDLARRAP